MKRRGDGLRWIATGGMAALFALVVADMPGWKAALSALYPADPEPWYSRAPLGLLVVQHLWLVAVSTVLAAGLGIVAGTAVTRKSGLPFVGVVDDLAALSQAIPPVAVLALAVPALGFGAAPTVLALFLYSLLPILYNTSAGLRSVPAEVVEAARGMGMTPLQLLMRVELPLAAPVIMAGVRTSVVVNIGTASIGAVVGAGGLGAPIISGLVRQEPSLVLEGAIAAGLLAFVVDQLLARLESTIAVPTGPASAPRPNRASG